MASRSFKPASYLASAKQAPNRSPRQRPAFTRNSSNGSVKSTLSDDSICSTLKSLVVEGRRDTEGEETDTTGRVEPRALATDDTPGRKRSQPIAIELPPRSLQRVYTPLSARGDLPGGYFPNHESPTSAPSHRSHPFSNTSQRYPDSPDMSATSSLAASLSDHPAARMHLQLPSTLPFAPSLLSPSIPEPLAKPIGKYHPSNYKSPNTTEVSTPTLAIPGSLQEKKRRQREKNVSASGIGGHGRMSSDVTRNIQQYQRDMIAQAQALAAENSMNGSSTERRASGRGEKRQPISPRLLPAGSPGPITPLELEDEVDAEEGYLAAGNRRNLMSKMTIQEPTFDRMIVVYRRAGTKTKSDRGIFVKHFKDIPMGDMEIVLVR